MVKYGKDHDRGKAISELFAVKPKIDRSEKVKATVFEETAKFMGERGYLN